MFTFGYKNKTGSLLRDVVCIALGVLLVFYPGAAISTIIVKVIGVLLVAFGVIETLALVGAMSLVGMGFMTFVFSGVAILFGIALIFSNFGLRTMGFITGIGLLWYILQLLGLNLPWTVLLGTLCLAGYLLEILSAHPKWQLMHVVKDDSLFDFSYI